MNRNSDRLGRFYDLEDRWLSRPFAGIGAGVAILVLTGAVRILRL